MVYWEKEIEKEGDTWRREGRKREKILRGEVDERRNEEKGILGEKVEQREQSRHS